MVQWRSGGPVRTCTLITGLQVCFGPKMWFEGIY